MRSKIPTHQLDHSFSKFEGGNSHIVIADFNDQSKIFDRQYPHRHNYYEIFILQESSGVHYIDFEAYPFSGAVIFLTAPEQVHQLMRDKGGYGYSIQFEEDFFNKDSDADTGLFSHFLFDHFQAHPVISINETELNKLKTLLSLSLEEYKTDRMGCSSLISAYVRIILMEILRIRKEQFQEHHLQVGPQQQQLLRFKQLLNAQFSSKHEVQDYAEQLRITPRQLNALCKQFLDKQASQVIKDRILLETKRLITINTLNIKEIGYELGFEDSAYFSRFFKQGTGMTAQEFKKSIIKTPV